MKIRKSCNVWPRQRAKFAVVFLLITAALPVRTGAASVLSLPEAINRALRFAPSIAVATANSDFSSAFAGEARAPLYPNLTGDLEYLQAPGYDPRITNRGQTTATVTMVYTAYDNGRRLALARAARYQSAAARLGLRAAQNQIVFDTTVAYFDLLRSQKAFAQLQASLDRLNRYVAVIEELERSGKAITNDVLRIRSARDGAELTLASSQQASQRAAIVLGSLIGDFNPSRLEVEDITALPALPTGELARNPVLQADQRNLDSAALAIKAAEAERSPNFNVVLSSGFLGVDPPNTFNRRLGASYDGAFSIPIFEGGLITAHINEARARQMAAVGQLKQDELIIMQRLADAAARYRQANRQLAILARSQPTAADAFALDWTRFLGGGNVTLLEVLDAYQQAESFRLARIDQEFAVRQAATETSLLYGEGS